MTTTATFLGIILDEKMSVKAQTTAVEIRCRKSLNVMRAIAGKSWGASKTCLLKIYRATIKSTLDYGSEAFDLSYKQNKRVYDSIQFQALKICCGSMIGTSSGMRRTSIRHSSKKAHSKSCHPVIGYTR